MKSIFHKGLRSYTKSGTLLAQIEGHKLVGNEGEVPSSQPKTHPLEILSDLVFEILPIPLIRGRSNQANPETGTSLPEPPAAQAPGGIIFWGKLGKARGKPA